MLATPKAPQLSGDARVAQLVILLLRHGADGSEGVMLNRPSFACVSDLLGWGCGLPLFKFAVVYCLIARHKADT